jgi:hypothetical protein
MEHKKILVIGMFDSIHFARWLEQFLNQDLDIMVLPSKKFRRVNKNLKSLLESNSNIKYGNFLYNLKVSAYIDYFLEKTFRFIPGHDFRVLLLNNILRQHDFYRVHALEIQGAGYLCLSWTEKFNTEFQSKLIVTNWGSDINFFMKEKKHLRKIEKVLQIASFYSAECNRDYDLAVSLGFSGALLPCIPNSGGVNFDETFTVSENDHRDLIIVKGYGGMFGRVDLAITAIDKILADFPKVRVFYYSVTDDIKPLVLKQIKSFPNEIKFSTIKTPLPYQEIMNRFKTAKIYVGISESDGISTSFLDAICTGAYPVQSNTSCANEWFERGIKGSLVGLSSNEVEKAIRYVFQNEYTVKLSTVDNYTIARRHLDYGKILNSALKFYE